VRPFPPRCPQSTAGNPRRWSSATCHPG
jgi:hypothetical protein